MRKTLDTLLEEMDRLLIEMGDLCVKAVMESTDAMKEKNREQAREIEAADDKIDELERKIDFICLKILLKENTFARDLRRVTAALKIVTDLERIGDQATDIAHIVVLLDVENMLAVDMLNDMALKACKMVEDSIQAFVNHDINLTRHIIEADDEIDDYFEDIREFLVERIKGHGEKGQQLLDVIMVSKYLERIGDHATNVAEWVEFSITGMHPSYGE